MSDLELPDGSRIQFPRRRETGGTIGVIAGERSGFTQFTKALIAGMTQAPAGTRLVIAQGVDPAGNCNQVCRQRTGDWLWLMGDDHDFDPGLLGRLLLHDVDVIVPHCLKRHPPWPPVVFSHQNEDGHYVTAELPGPEEDPFEIHAAGSAGMLIREHVLAAIDDPWFIPGPGAVGLNEDLEFCRKVREAGFRIWCDPGALLGHISIHTVWPQWRGDGWHLDLVHDQQASIPIQRPERAVPESKIESVR